MNWFRRLLGGFGKRVFRWKAKKISLFAYNSMIRSVLKKYGELNENNYEQGTLDFSSQLEVTGKNIIIEMINKPILFGLSLDTVLSEDITDLPFIVSLALYFAFGKAYKKIWTPPFLVPEENGVLTWVLTQKKCLACAGETKLTQKDLGKTSMCNIIAYVWIGMLRALEDYLNFGYDITVKTTKCFMKDDDYGEFQYTFIPRPKSNNETEDPFI
ncbi:MAG: hypothetical protein ACFFG0_07095 [Candidatus Thorarchaeota archaeon]